MPYLFSVRGYDIKFFVSDGNEPIHVHAVHGNKSVKLWLLRDGSIEVARGSNHGVSSKDVSLLIKYLKLDYGGICMAWARIFGSISFYK